MHTITFLLKTTKSDICELEKRICVLWRMHNALVKHARHCLNRMQNDREYRNTLSRYKEVLDGLEKNGLSEDKTKLLESEKETLSDKLDAIRTENGLSKSQFEKYIAVMQRRYKHLITSQQAQKEAARVWAGVEKLLFSNGKTLHFKKLRDMYSISQKCSTNGAKLDIEYSTLTWLGLKIPVKINKADRYVQKSIAHKLKYCELKRLRFKSGDRWYVTAYFDGPAPKKLTPAKGDFGIDPGTATEAIVSDNGLILTELAPKCVDYNKRIAREQRLIDVATRRDNPDNYDTDGKVKKGRHKWTISNGCRKRKAMLSMLYRKKAAYTKQFQFELIGRIIKEYGANGTVEAMDYKALQKRSKKKPERKTVPSKVKRNDGSVITVYKFKQKRRFGKSLNDRAPSQFLKLLEVKCAMYGGNVRYTDTKAFRASQYHHDTDEYTKVDLSDRWKVIEGHKVQRDLYSGFLTRHSNKDGTAPNREQCQLDFDRFVKMHDAFILEHTGEPHPASFGF